MVGVVSGIRSVGIAVVVIALVTGCGDPDASGMADDADPRDPRSVPSVDEQWELSRESDDAEVVFHNDMVVTADSQSTVVFDAGKGTELWRFDARELVGVSASAVAVFVSDSEVVSYDLGDGSKNFSVTIDPMLGGARVIDDMLIVNTPGNAGDVVTAYGMASDGEELWRRELAGGTTINVPASTAGKQVHTRLFLTEQTYQDPISYTLDVHTGEDRQELPAPMNTGDDEIELVSGGGYVVRHAQDDCTVLAYHIDSAGQVVNTTEFNCDRELRSAEGGPNISVTQDLILGRNDAGEPHLVTAEAGEPVWTADRAANPVALHATTAIYEVPAETDDGPRTVEAVDTASGEVLWSREWRSHPGAFMTAEVIGNTLVDTSAALLESTAMAGFDPGSAEPLWKAAYAEVAAFGGEYLALGQPDGTYWAVVAGH